MLTRKRIRSEEVLFFHDYMKCIESGLQSTYMLSEADAKEATKELFRGLQIFSESDDYSKLGFPPVIDMAWHIAILNTEWYSRHCQLLFGKMIHHTTRTETNEERIQATIEAYKKTFGDEAPAIWKPPKYNVQIFVKDLQNRTRGFNVDLSMTGLQLKQLLHSYDYASVDQLRLICSGKQIQDTTTLAEANVGSESTVHVLLRMRGC